MTLQVLYIDAGDIGICASHLYNKTLYWLSNLPSMQPLFLKASVNSVQAVLFPMQGYILHPHNLLHSLSNGPLQINEWFLI